MGSINEFLYQKLVWFGGFFWVSVSTLFLALLPLVSKFFFRVQGDKSSLENKSNCSAVALHESNNVDDSALVKQEAEFEETKAGCFEFKDSGNDEEDSPKFLKFKFQTFEEFNRSSKGNWDVVPLTSTSKYEFKSEKYLSGFIEGPEDVSFTVKELYADSKNNSTSSQEIIADKFLSEKYFIQQDSGGETVRKEEAEDSRDSACRKELPAKAEVTALIEDSKPALDVDNNKASDQDGAGDLQFLSEKDLIASDSDSDSIALSNEHSAMSQFIGSTSDGFLSDKDFEEEFEFNIMRDINGEKVELAAEDLDLEKLYLHNFSDEADEYDDEDSDIMEEPEKLEESEVKNSSTQDSEMFSENDFQEKKDSKNGEVVGKEKIRSKESNKSSLQNSSSAALDSEDSNGLETLWEHQDLIEQLKMELKKVRAIGLPTILEESESPKITEDLKPWKIDEKFQHEDTMDELHKFYKSYRERMRKFDILNYQKMYAIGFLQSSKDPLKSISSLNYSSNPGVASLLSQNFLMGGKRKKSESDPMKKFIRELHSDLEVVYVGQLCLSWEILHWQYEKSLELWESDPYGIRRYNEVAGEFQQFQVLMQRFIENEPFEGPRVQNYIKNRCVLRNLLQVPVIREDSRKDKKKAKTERRDDYAITSDMLVEIMEESIRIFWRFVRADKDANIPIQKSRKSTQVEPQDSLDLELLAEVRSSLQKKEKKLKDILRSGNCLLRKFQKQQDNSEQVLYFFSQVDMKLVARVLNMSRITTDQLLWCRNKLSKINFVSRKKIHVEPSFFLFPC